MAISAEAMDKVADIARGLLEERFGDDFVFDPIYCDAQDRPRW